ncbi:MAG TPA: hypothetical protein VGH19_16725 [Verrucomicrobiae bacterium]
MRTLLSSLLLAATVLNLSAADTKELPKDVKRIPVTFSGGYDTDPRDKGRPVILIAGALGVQPQVFRDAFSNVHPAGPDRGPTDAEARKNKEVLMKALGKHGITNERLDEVSNYYRYVKSRGETWKHKDAKANALVKDGAVIGYEITEGGSGYSSVPTITVPGIKDAKAKVEVSYSKTFEKNGKISAMTIVK